MKVRPERLGGLMDGQTTGEVVTALQWMCPQRYAPKIEKCAPICAPVCPRMMLDFPGPYRTTDRSPTEGKGKKPEGFEPFRL